MCKAGLLPAVHQGAPAVFLKKSRIPHKGAKYALFAVCPSRTGKRACYYYGLLVYSDSFGHKQQTNVYGEGPMAVIVKQF